MTRRQALLLGAALPARAQQDPRQFTSVFAFEEEARRKLDAALFAEIAGGDRSAFERITFRPRLMVDATKLDLSVELLGARLFAPILVAPSPKMARFHPEGELAMAQGAAAAKVSMIVPADTSKPLAEIAAACAGPFWLQVNAATLVPEGCKAVFVPRNMKAAFPVPAVATGIGTADQGAMAVEQGVQAVAVTGIDVLPAVAERVAGRVPILVEGSFRRGTDIMKGLALGARAVLIRRPAMWGLAGYGAAGVQAVFEILVTELARTMAMCGCRSVAEIDAGVVRVHRR